MLRLGFACVWDRPPEPTWSHTPWMLRASLRDLCKIEDIDLTFPAQARQALRLLHARPHGGQISSTWSHQRPARFINERRLSRLSRSLDVDALLQIGDIGSSPIPYFIVGDLSYDLLLDTSGSIGIQHQFPALSVQRIKALRDRQRSIFSEASGIIALSKWYGQSLTRLSGIPPEKVHVVYPGSTSIGTVCGSAAARRQMRPRRRLLFVGRDFARKGGEETVEALTILRRDFDPEIQLTIAGPPEWPLSGARPSGVTFLGNVPPQRVATLLDEHDALVVPSKFEAFGIVFVEALSRGVPCVARNEFAMPEIIRPGINGALVDSASPQEIATAVADLLEDDDVFARTELARAEASRFYSWHRVAEESLAAIYSHL